MTGIFQGLAASDGKIPAVVVTSLPADVVARNGLLVRPSDGALYVVNDSMQPRFWKYGIAFEEATGLVILGNESAMPYSVPMGGMLVDANGALLGSIEDPDVIHQAVGLKFLDPAGVVTGEGFVPAISNQLDASQDQVNKTGDVVSSVVAVDGKTYNVQGGSGVTHGTIKSPTNLDTYSFDGSLNSFLRQVSNDIVNQPFTVFVTLRKGATGTRVVFDNK